MCGRGYIARKGVVKEHLLLVISVVMLMAMSRQGHKYTLALLARRATRVLVIWARERGFCGRDLPRFAEGVSVLDWGIID